MWGSEITLKPQKGGLFAIADTDGHGLDLGGEDGPAEDDTGGNAWSIATSGGLAPCTHGLVPLGGTIALFSRGQSRFLRMPESVGTAASNAVWGVTSADDIYVQAYL